MSMQDSRLLDIIRHDPRYMYEAYEFVLESLTYTQKMLGRVPGKGVSRESSDEYHVSGPELVAGCCEYACEQFGWMARTVFRQWGIRTTGDIGEIVFNMINWGMLSKTENDSLEDFQNLFDLDRALTEGFTISMDEIGWKKRGSS